MPTFSSPLPGPSSLKLRAFFLSLGLACLATGCSRTGTVTVESGRPVRSAPVEQLVEGTVDAVNVSKNGSAVGLEAGGSDHVYDLSSFNQDGRLEEQLLDHNYVTRPVGGVVRLSIAPGW